MDQALGIVEDLLRHAVAQATSEIRVIHGQGTGVLRTAVREYLTDHPLVEANMPDPDNVGDGGTLVFLK